MGIISKQAYSNTIYSVIGIIAGAINTIFILPRAFEQAPDDLGLIRVLLAQAAIFGTVFGFGMFNLIIKENTEDRGEEYKKSILGFSLIISSIGFIILSLVLILFPNILSSLINENEAPRVISNLYSLIILAFSVIFGQYFSSYITNKHKSPFVQFIRDPFLKITYLILALAYLINPFSFDLFLRIFVLTHAASVILMVAYSMKLGYSARFSTKLINIKELGSYSLYTILDKGAAIIANNLDLIMIGMLLNLDNVGIYSIAFFMGAVILIPQKAIMPPSYPLVASFLKSNKKAELEKLYKQSSINQLLIGGVIFTLIWVNIDSIFQLMPDKFSEKWVVFYIGISKLLILSTGISGPIIVFSKYYKYNIIFNLLMIITAIVSNYLLIPIYGMTGAALATAITYGVFNLIKYIFIRHKFHIQPFTITTAKIILSIIITLFIGSLLEFNMHFIISIFLKSLIVGISLLILLRILKTDAEILKIIPYYKGR